MDPTYTYCPQYIESTHVSWILYECGHKQVKYLKKRWNNKEIFIENKYVNRVKKKGGVNSMPCGIGHVCGTRPISESFI